MGAGAAADEDAARESEASGTSSASLASGIPAVFLVSIVLSLMAGCRGSRGPFLDLGTPVRVDAEL